jgi:hypothetical protein
VSHYEISPREREDEAREWEREFGTVEFEQEDLQDRIRRTGEGPPDEA